LGNWNDVAHEGQCAHWTLCRTNHTETNSILQFNRSNHFYLEIL
jgi:deoxycytidylate deaminase